jgi:hypothetical protein
MAKARDYKEEYRKYHGTAEYRKDRASRNKIRRKMEKQGRVRKGDGKDIDHKNGNPRDNRPANLRIVPKSVNRAKK